MEHTKSSSKERPKPLLKLLLFASMLPIGIMFALGLAFAAALFVSYRDWYGFKLLINPGAW